MIFNRSLCVLAFTIGFSVTTAYAQAASQRFDINIGTTDAAAALNTLSRQTNYPLLFNYEQIKSLRVNSLKGNYTLEEALTLIFKGTGFEGHLLNGEALTVSPVQSSETQTEEENMILKGRKKQLLTGASAAIMSATVPAAAIAQEAPVDEVVAVGIRQSLKASSDIKRNSDSVVDVITAEEAGKFPDSNVAEALQRIPGVTIDRDNGEGQSVTVRGFGPDFNTVLLNGRRLANDGANSRGFNFDTISSELIGGAEVYKTAPSHLQEGGIGSTINLATLRPLDVKDGLGVLKVQGNYESLSDEVAPSAFGLFSKKFANATIGILGSISYQRRKSTREVAQTDGYIRQTVVEGATDGFANAVGNTPGTFFLPRNFNLFVDDQDRERIGGNVTLQFEPNETINLTIDALHSQFVVDSNANTLATFYVPNDVRNATIDSNNTLTAFDNINRVNAYVQQSFNRDAKVTAIAGNLEFTPNEKFSGDIDISYSDAENDGTSDDGRNFFSVVRDFSTLRFDNTAGGVPSLSSDPGFGLDLNALTSHFTRRNGTTVQDEIFEVKGNFAYQLEIGPFQELTGGVLYSTEDRSTDEFLSANPCFNCGDTVPIPAGFVTELDTTGFLSDSGGNFPDFFPVYDVDQVIDFYESAEGLAARDANLGLAPGTSAAALPATGFDPVLLPGNSFGVSEDLLAFHANIRLGDDGSTIPWTLNAGFRWVETDVTSNGTERTLTDLTPIPNDPTEFAATFAADNPVTAESSYSNFLPSVNFKVEPVEDLVLRMAFSKTLTRPGLSLLNPVLTFPAQFRPSLLNATGGNVELEPFVSDNWDIAAEYYFGSGSYISGAFFQKSVDGFIVTTVGAEPLPIANSGGISNPLIQGGTATFNITRPQNLETASVEGFELGVQHTFENGFGFQANATFVDSDAVVDVNNIAQNFALEGLGDSRSAVVFYENDKFNARVAYTQRDEFLQAASTGAGGEPLFTGKFDQLDARVTYFINDTFEIFADGINLLGEDLRQRGRFENHFGRLEKTGARFTFGGAARF